MLKKIRQFKNSIKIQSYLRIKIPVLAALIYQVIPSEAAWVNAHVAPCEKGTASVPRIHIYSVKWRRKITIEKISALVVLGVIFLFQSSAFSQTTTPDLEFLRQQERERILRQQQEKTPNVHLEPLPAAPETVGRLPTKEATCFPIKEIILAGDSVQKFQFAIPALDIDNAGNPDSASGRCLGSLSINVLMERLQNAMIKRGFVTTRVVAAPQDLGSGILKLTVVPGRVRYVRFADGTDPRARLRNAVPITRGEILNIRAIEQALENFKRLPTVEADIQVVPAEGSDANAGESDLVISWKQSKPFRLSFSVDDSGTDTTGKYIGTLTLSLDSLLTLNDLFYVSTNHELGGGEAGARGANGTTFHYSLPFGYWLLGFTESNYAYYQTVVGATQNFVYSGQTQNNEIKLSRVVYRDAVSKTTMSFSLWDNTANNFIDDTEVLVQQRRMAGWSAGVNHHRTIGNSTLDANVNYKQGTGANGALPAPEDAFGEGTSRSSILTSDMQVNIPFSLAAQNWRYNIAIRDQWNFTPLVPQDRFAIGGRFTVRGFDGDNLLSADNGWLIRNDLCLVVGQSGQEIYLGVDHGEVGGQSAATLVGTSLTGGVIGYRGAYLGTSYDFFIGKPFSRPAGFQTASAVTGFSLNWNY